ncbi:hypothetical protein [Acidithiobacillus sp. AMEEHan]|uniref:hypothetical protein n=1 Tax=Acidithiobacillus sp. AMEEHan TaxID=2994951 RepID=UPI0027E4B8D7|nr:hypothetical protein [Acidithiobacillus sp. AMEEHan]
MSFHFFYRKNFISGMFGIGLLALAPLSQAAAFGNIIPGAGVIHVPVAQHGRHAFYPCDRQHTDFSCGAASLATILKYAFGQDVTEESVMKGLFTVSNPAVVRKVGFSLLDIKNIEEKNWSQGSGL